MKLSIEKIRGSHPEQHRKIPSKQCSDSIRKIILQFCDDLSLLNLPKCMSPLKAGPEIRIQVQVVYLGDSGNMRQGMWPWCWGRELSLQRKNCLAMSWVIISHGEDCFAGGRPGVHSLALEPVSSRSPAVSLPTEKTFRHMMEELADGLHQEDRKVQREDRASTA